MRNGEDKKKLITCCSKANLAPEINSKLINYLLISAALPSFMSANLDRIVGGQAATAPIPWQVSLRQCNQGFCHSCGGTVLDAKTILTAAHCKVTVGSWFIMAGETNRNKGTNIKVSKVINGAWVEMTNDNDIAILKLETPLTLGGNIQAACLPSATFNPATGATCHVSGWGTMKFGASSLPEMLQWVSVPVYDQAKCKTAYSDLTANMICAGFEKGGKDSCQGDSGGPMVCMENNKPVITGVVSFGDGCAKAKYPGVYARVTKYLTWIKANMEQTTSPPAPTPAPPAGVCGSPQWKGDMFCDDDNNNAGCQYDGGDCCGTNVDKTYCTECKCKDPKAQ